MAVVVVVVGVRFGVEKNFWEVEGMSVSVM
jgi:hypothetical protein